MNCRKTSLVGLILLVGRGSTAQLVTALAISVGFFALQCNTMPFKINADNWFRENTKRFQPQPGFLTNIHLNMTSCCCCFFFFHSGICTELHVMIAIAASFVLAKTDLRFEKVQNDFYSIFLLITFIALVPGAFVMCVVSKVRAMNAAVTALEVGPEKTEHPLQQRRRAFDLHVVGLGSAEEKKMLQRYVDGWAVHGDHTCFLS